MITIWIGLKNFVLIKNIGKNIKYFKELSDKNLDEVSAYVLDILKDGDYVLVKASHGMHLEKIVEENFFRKDESYPNILKSEIGYNLNINTSEKESEVEMKSNIKRTLKAIKAIEETKRIKSKLEGGLLKWKSGRKH